MEKEGNVDKALPGVLLLSLISLDCTYIATESVKYSEKRKAESIFFVMQETQDKLLNENLLIFKAFIFFSVFAGYLQLSYSLKCDFMKHRF